ncbi:hypothetical protein M413DRAFT_410062 [Hebeloma cylindrosporum]|uniref:Uncharacterized protein n=1 Tax=Hebeloma cylindrosporum TaxID=76867 RepID=A0A0C2XVV7_HEBCY|nr:hypothetical protein M413DRAFT_410062 [Hebeloma cylindrosporum h7]
MAPRNFPAPQLKPSTRSKNKDAHPGQPVIDAKQPRRSKQEMEVVRAQQAREQEEEKTRLETNLKAVAQIEDELLQEDIQRRTSNHRSVGIAPFKPQLQADNGGNLKVLHSLTSEIPIELENPAGSNVRVDDEDEGSEGSQDEYRPPACEGHVESESDGESEAPVDSHTEETTTKNTGTRKGKKPKPGRKDVVAVRETVAEKGTPATAEATKLKRKADDSNENINKKSKKTNQPLSGLIVGWDRNPSGSRATASIASEVSQDIDESMVQYGGLVDDEENDEIERVAIRKDVPKDAGGKKTLPSLIKITDSKPTTQLTKKTIRNGARKWKLEHLPPGTDRGFTDQFIPLVKAKAGELEHPWAELNPSQVQELVDHVFGHDTYTVVAEDVWCGLIAYRLSNWRNIFGSTAASAVKAYIESNPENMFVRGAEDIAEFGCFQNELIMYTLAHAHFADFDDVPDAEKLERKPVGALILAIQAVEHAFKSWTTGAYVKITSPKGYFSADNYGDKIMKVAGKDRRTKHVNNRRATQYTPTINAFKDHHWNSILSAVRDILGENGNKRKRSKSASSRASSEFDMDEVEADKDYILLSDDD